ncbi:hypothetical protein INT44_007256 [Umbelopsis vinacea]|uniref:LysM domain-containing protein n=1 Tax=Umbelopsis vinacea TaxID=44442 RepID=A0A8H7PM49_9FUNG|nr:hypothetical protein INT44_007256 [Umbelopsis vinacea]
MRIAALSFFAAALAAVAVEAAPNNLAMTVSCSTQYIVQANDKCYKIAHAYNIAASNLLKWNPQVNSACTNLYIGERLCLSAPNTVKSLVATKGSTTTKKTSTKKASTSTKKSSTTTKKASTTTKKSSTSTKKSSTTTKKASTSTKKVSTSTKKSSTSTKKSSTSTKKSSTTTKKTSTTATKTSTIHVIVPTTAQCASDVDCPGVYCCNLFNKQCVLDPNNNICGIQPTTKVATVVSGKTTTTKVAATTAKTVVAAVPSYVPGVTVALNSKSSFCLLLPPSAGNKANNGNKQDVEAVSDSEDYAVSFCTVADINAPKARAMPAGFITSANYQTNSTAGFIQVTGSINPAAYGLSANDQGGQYDNHGSGKPAHSACAGFPYYVQMVEPNINGFCIRCCTNYQDCNASRSEYGCHRVVPPLTKSV